MLPDFDSKSHEGVMLNLPAGYITTGRILLAIQGGMRFDADDVSRPPWLEWTAFTIGGGDEIVAFESRLRDGQVTINTYDEDTQAGPTISTRFTDGRIGGVPPWDGAMMNDVPLRLRARIAQATHQITASDLARAHQRLLMIHQEEEAMGPDATWEEKEALRDERWTVRRFLEATEGLTTAMTALYITDIA